MVSFFGSGKVSGKNAPGVFLLCAVALWMAAGGTFAASQIEPRKDETRHPLWTLLEKEMTSRTLKVGDVVRAKVSYDWTSRNCFISDGAEVRGKVVRIEPKQSGKKQAEVTLRFSVTCVEGQTLKAQLIALLYPKSDENKGQMGTYMDMPMGIGPGASGRQSTDVATLPSPMGNGPPEPEPKIKLGQVRGVRHVSLRVPAKRGDAILTSGDDRLKLQQWTRMAFWVESAQP